MIFPAYPNYKDSGVEWLGEVPDHWSVQRLRYVANINPPKSEVRDLPDDTAVTFLPMEAVAEEGYLDLTKERALGELVNDYTYIREGDVAYAKITPCFENGKVALIQGALNGVAFGTTELTVLRPDPQKTISEYLFRVVSSEPFRSLGEASMYGAGGQKRVPEDYTREFTIGWPPIVEQRQIARFLDHETSRIDALIEEQQRLIDLLKEKRQAVISHAVTKGLDTGVPMKDSGLEWLGKVPAHWELCRIKHMIRAHGGATPAKERLEFWDGDIPWVCPKDMKKDRLSDATNHVTKEALLETGLSIIDAGSVLIVARGMILAHSLPVAVADAPLTINQDIKALVPYYHLLTFR